MLNGINVWAQYVARHFSIALNAKYMLRRQLLRLVQPTPYCGLRYTKIFGHGLLRAVGVNGQFQSFVPSECFHTRPYIRPRYSVNGKVE